MIDELMSLFKKNTYAVGTPKRVHSAQESLKRL